MSTPRAPFVRGAPALVCVLALLSASCLGYSDTAADAADAVDAADVPDASAPSSPVRESDADADADSPSAVASDASEPEQTAPRDAGAAPVAVPIEANLRLGHTASFDGYLMDDRERPLYMFADDVAGSASSSCSGACVRDWPPFDLPEPVPEPGILINELTRFHRQDGRWQSAYKGHPLYYHAAEDGLREVTADGRDGRWFVARDYLAFIAVDASFAPAGSQRFGAGFLTNGFGRALYVCFDDTPGSAEAPPVSACLGECARRHPLWSVSEAGRTTILPSLLDALDITTFERPDGALQLALRGWPLYYFSGDERAGDVNGQNQNAWRAIDPLYFGEADAESLAFLRALTQASRGVQANRR